MKTIHLKQSSATSFCVHDEESNHVGGAQRTDDGAWHLVLTANAAGDEFDDAPFMHVLGDLHPAACREHIEFLFNTARKPAAAPATPGATSVSESKFTILFDTLLTTGAGFAITNEQGALWLRMILRHAGAVVYALDSNTDHHEALIETATGVMRDQLSVIARREQEEERMKREMKNSLMGMLMKSILQANPAAGESDAQDTATEIADQIQRDVSAAGGELGGVVVVSTGSSDSEDSAPAAPPTAPLKH